jgi:hypothetical protein
MNGIPLGEWNGSNATKDLHKTFFEMHNVNAKESKKMVFLTWAILILAFIILVLTTIMAWPAILELTKKI